MPLKFRDYFQMGDEKALVDSYYQVTQREERYKRIDTGMKIDYCFIKVLTRVSFYFAIIFQGVVVSILFFVS